MTISHAEVQRLQAVPLKHLYFGNTMSSKYDTEYSKVWSKVAAEKTPCQCHPTTGTTCPDYVQCEEQVMQEMAVYEITYIEVTRAGEATQHRWVNIPLNISDTSTEFYLTRAKQALRYVKIISVERKGNVFSPKRCPEFDFYVESGKIAKRRPRND